MLTAYKNIFIRIYTFHVIGYHGNAIAIAAMRIVLNISGLRFRNKYPHIPTHIWNK